MVSILGRPHWVLPHWEKGSGSRGLVGKGEQGPSVDHTPPGAHQASGRAQSQGAGGPVRCQGARVREPPRAGLEGGAGDEFE